MMSKNCCGSEEVSVDHTTAPNRGAGVSSIGIPNKLLQTNVESGNDIRCYTKAYYAYNSVPNNSHSAPHKLRIQ